MKTVDADLGKTRKDISIKGAELERVNRDILLEKEKLQQEKKVNSRLQSDLESKKKIVKESEKVIAELESKVCWLIQDSEIYQFLLSFFSVSSTLSHHQVIEYDHQVNIRWSYS